MRRTPFLLLLAGVLAILPACSNGPGVAARINGAEISTDALNQDLQGVAASKVLRDQLAQQNVILKPGGPVPMSFASQWLASMIQNEAVAQIAAKRHVRTTAQELAQTSTQLEQSNGAAFQQIPASLKRRLVQQRALLAALRASYPAQSPYAALQADCPTERLVGHILVATEAEAQQVIDRLDAGESFATVSSDVSKDTTAAAQGGLLLCENSSQWTQLDADFRAGAEAVPTGGISPPVKTQFGYHVIEVLPLTEANAQPMLASVQTPDPLAAVLGPYLVKASIYVNPRYGKLQRSATSFNIVPPTPKQVKSRPASTTTTTVPVGATPTPAPSGASSSGG